MTPQELLLATFRGEPCDQVPWFADLTYWYSGRQAYGTLPERYAGDGVALLYSDLNVGCHEHMLAFCCRAEYDEVDITQQVHEAGGERKLVTRWSTPVGTIEQVQQWEPLSATWAYRQYPVATVDDLRVLRFVHEHEHLTPDYTAQERQIALFGEWGVASSIPRRTPFANLAVIWMGVTNTVYAMHDAPAEFEATLEVLDRADDPVYEAIAGSPAPLVYFGENITGELVSPRIFARYYAPYYARRVPECHAAGKFIFVHVDGTFRRVLGPLAATGVDCAQSLTPAPVGDVEIAEMRELAGPDLILWGGLPAVLFSPIYPEQVLRDCVAECLRCYRDDPRFMLCVCDQVPPDADLERVAMVSEIVAAEGARNVP